MPTTLLPWIAHVYTVTGVLLGFRALLAVVAYEFRTAFLWLFIAILVDASDGWIARRFAVSERLPFFDGQKLDDIVDYVTYVFVPVFLLYYAGLLPPLAALPIAGAVMLASAYSFAHKEAKTPDHYFTGFPCFWNVVVLYLYLAQLATVVNAIVLLLLCGLVFVRTTYLHPARTTVWRRSTMAAASAWGGVMLWMIWALPQRWPWVLIGSLAFPVYYLTASVVLHRRRRRTSAPA